MYESANDQLIFGMPANETVVWYEDAVLESSEEK